MPPAMSGRDWQLNDPLLLCSVCDEEQDEAAGNMSFHQPVHNVSLNQKFMAQWVCSLWAQLGVINAPGPVHPVACRIPGTVTVPYPATRPRRGFAAADAALSNNGFTAMPWKYRIFNGCQENNIVQPRIPQRDSLPGHSSAPLVDLNAKNPQILRSSHRIRNRWSHKGHNILYISNTTVV